METRKMSGAEFAEKAMDALSRLAEAARAERAGALAREAAEADVARLGITSVYDLGNPHDRVFCPGVDRAGCESLLPVYATPADLCSACRKLGAKAATSREPECQGHPARSNDPMGQTVYCDGSCRKAEGSR
ncbi:MAG TPA: hypothetical protein VMY76_00695 [Gemmatimonadales bacterium]|nr:hypothetical protein [Gemmatimonadales bacterium]